MKRLLLSACVLLLPWLSYANHCHELHLTIKNETGVACHLVDTGLKHGHFIDGTNAPQDVIAHQESAPVSLEQATFFGPDLVLTYNCGGRMVSLESQQNLCLIYGGNVTANVLTHDDLTVDSERQTGSFIWGTHGEIWWTIS